MVSDLRALLFADDTTFQASGACQTELFEHVNSNLKRAQEWFSANYLTLNSSKTKYVLFSPPNSHVHSKDLYLAGAKIDRIGKGCKEKSFKFLGVQIDENFSWEMHILSIRKKINSSIFGLSNSRHFLPLHARKNIYNSLVFSHVNYCSLIYGCADNKFLNLLNSQLKKAIRHVNLSQKNTHAEPIFKKFGCLNLYDLIFFNRSLFVHKFIRGRLPQSFNSILTLKSEVEGDRFRDEYAKIVIPPLKKGIKIPHFEAAKSWNCLPRDIKLIESEKDFKTRLKCYILDKYECD